MSDIKTRTGGVAGHSYTIGKNMERETLQAAYMRGEQLLFFHF